MRLDEIINLIVQLLSTSYEAKTVQKTLWLPGKQARDRLSSGTLLLMSGP